MEFTIFHAISILGLILIIVGTIVSKRNKEQRKVYYTLLILGGICLEVYSIYLKDVIFIILQALFIITAIWGIVRNSK
ncbi:MAG: YgjV family protein [Nanoarchaeota archaeon]|nr:YgjV family protein [Nanoarchaeota archaeon]